MDDDELNKLAQRPQRTNLLNIFFDERTARSAVGKGARCAPTLARFRALAPMGARRGLFPISTRISSCRLGNTHVCAFSDTVARPLALELRLMWVFAAVFPY